MKVVGSIFDANQVVKGWNRGGAISIKGGGSNTTAIIRACRFVKNAVNRLAGAHIYAKGCVLDMFSTTIVVEQINVPAMVFESMAGGIRDVVYSGYKEASCAKLSRGCIASASADWWQCKSPEEQGTLMPCRQCVRRQSL